ncbi:hypothetical protein Q9S36_11590 [Microbacterium sp. ARD31]|uniref:DUF7882 family protein n=1 Tax=Microbacterium sp. ARD31 TaxID=2962576 RepID=UPI0028829EEE|nr:hypothetical protein [Microbacterium sp. ARD31]MDT0180836.1 hypothetical protein [Microbacterium sp. ARD31]
MGSLYYGNVDSPIVMPDRILAHLAAVATTKLRRSESFVVSWKGTGEEGEGRTTLWFQPAIPLRFVYDQAAAVPLNPATLREMADQATSNGGLILDADLDIPEITAARPETRRPVAAA